MPEQLPQVSKLAGALVEHQRGFEALSSVDRQWVIQNTTLAIALFVEAVKNYEPAGTKSLFERLSTFVALPAVTSFTASENFVINTSSGAKMKINRFCNNFKANFLPKIESGKVAAEDLVVNKLLEHAHVSDIITALGGEAKVEMSLGQFFAAFAKQPNGEAGALLTNGYANAGFVRDVNGVLWVVDGGWSGGGWGFFAYPRDCTCMMRGGFQFLSR